jgi:large repetitive protein
VSTNYVVNVSGFTDQAGNVVTAFTSNFTTGASSVGDVTRPTVVSISPASGASGVAVTSSVVVTFSEAVDATTVNGSTVQVSASGTTTLAGSYGVSGSVVTFTPLTALPGNTQITVQVNFNGVTDQAGNGTNGGSSSFTTAGTVDTVAPVVVMVTPGNGTSGVGLNATVAMTFSKSLNGNSINTSNFGLLANGARLGVSVSSSSDNRVVFMNAGTLPASSVVTVIATSGVTDLSGNALSNYESSFTTATFDTTAPVVVSQRPGNGATQVPVGTSIVLYLSEAMNTGTEAGAVHVSQNGVLVNGTVQVSDAGQVVVFTPGVALQNGALVQVFMDGSAKDVDGNSLSGYQGSFTTAGDAATTAPVLVAESPASGAQGVARNVVMELGYSEPLAGSTVNGNTVQLLQCCYTPIPVTVSLVNGGTAIAIVPNAPLQANTTYFYQVLPGVLGVNGQGVAASGLQSFTTGSVVDTTGPVVVSVSPPNGAVNVGDNVQVHVVFNKGINPVTVNGGTIQLSGGGQTAVADAINFGNGNQSVVLVPHGPLADNTVMTLTISGVTDVAGNVVSAQSTTFTTGTGPDVVAPVVVGENPGNSGGSVPLNAPIQLQMNEPMDPGSVNGNTLQVQDATTGQILSGSYSVSADGQTVSFVPGAALAVSRSYNVFFASRGMVDLAGNQLGCGGLCNYTFTTGTAASVVAPQVVGVSPVSGLSGVPINAQVAIGFNEPVDGVTLGQVTLSGSSGVVSVSKRLVNGNTVVVLVPSVPLATGASYTVSVAGVQDTGGNVMVGSFTSTFTTSGGADLVGPTVVNVSPANGAGGVPTNAVVQLQFSKRVNPLTVTNSTFLVTPTNTGVPIAGTISVSADGLTASFTPSAPLNTTVTYQVQASNGITDLAGLQLSTFFSSFQ